MGFDKMIIKQMLNITQAPPLECYQKDFPLNNPHEVIIDTKKNAIKHAIDHVLWQLFNHKSHCSYCGFVARYWDTRPNIALTIRPVNVYKDVPKGAKDLKIIVQHGWLADLQHSGYEIICPKCGLKLIFEKGYWGLLCPMYGSSTRDFLLQDGSKYSTIKKTIKDRVPSCFSRGTLVLLPKSMLKPIEEIHEGDTIVSYNLHKNNCEADTVVGIYASLDCNYHVINGELKVTGLHRFLMNSGEWKQARLLSPGDRVKGLISDININSVETRMEELHFFNFHVSNNKSYFVSPDGIDFYAVHNGK